MKTLDEIMAYLDCPRKYSFMTVGDIKEDMSPNTIVKVNVKKAVTEVLKNNIGLDKFKSIVGGETITHSGRTTIKTELLYNLIKNSDLKETDEIKVVLKKTDYSKSLYYTMYQVIEKQNAELVFKVIILNTVPIIDTVTLAPKSKSEVMEVNLLNMGVNRVIDLVDKNNLLYIKRPNNISCSGCLYNKECKPLCFTRKDEEV